MSIWPLPDEVVAQIKSSTAIVSLSGVVLELLKNSLDAKASRINITVDFARGGCVVEDDGLGIPPAEFSDDGGLGKLYYTSKFHSDEPQLGQHGTFLASLSAMSLLTITSHHHAYRSHNSISFHHAQTIERQTPAPTHNHVYAKHGTRVSVRNLFGNMPVRVKQRSMIVDQKTEQHRFRNAVKRDTVGLLLSWQGPILLKICDSDGHTIVHINTSNAAVAGSSRDVATAKPQSAHLSSLFQIMTQAKYIDFGDRSSWVPASASTPAISVKGAISLEPAPTKHAQFISLGLRPLSSESGNELYDQVNRLFAQSSFGIVEDDADVDEKEKLRRLSDKRYKNDGYTNRQLKARKGVDRYPMFHLRVLLKDRPALKMLDDRFIEDESTLQAVLDVFSAMITQWLSAHHFRPRKQHPGQSLTATPSQDLTVQSSTPSRKRQVPSGTAARSSTGSPSMSTPNLRSNAPKRQRRATESLEKALEMSRPQAFADWSRIKSGRSSFFKTTDVSQKVRALEFAQDTHDQALHDGSSRSNSNNSRQEDSILQVAPITKGALSGAALANNAASVPEDKDGVLLWTDPSTKKTYHLNARTGCVIPPERPQAIRTALPPSTSRLNASKSSRVSLKSAVAEPTQSRWLGGLLQTWDNPIFRPSEKSIQRISLQTGEEQGGIQGSQHSHLRCSDIDMQKAFDDARSVPSRISKDALRRAEVISQVDKKFILVKIAGSSVEPEAQLHTNIMVLIDQHAADERVQVETLLHDLCRPVHNDDNINKGNNNNSDSQPRTGPSPLVAHALLEKPLHFAISSCERTHFATFAADFTAWGILYDLSDTGSDERRPLATEKIMCTLSVAALPPAVSERCKADPGLLISFLRSAVWKYVESPPLSSTASSDQHTSWVKKIATCPPGLIDMINSRACRSAIMFNDELDLDSCKALVTKLADCHFPFMCAHGRPSLVPIVDMGRIEAKDNAGDSMSFVDAWKKWRS
ncbi:hypothetical protein OPT61_g8920 [Boeremia exigua]|uniref:Uncharacterized protein n=1 Tax=Boeremia exigua TaxID=749465 RepID=A0ACC2HWD0_9PLEO|nr:hypothetical protein OPT61_g8920 [Boeremia exigua]